MEGERKEYPSQAIVHNAQESRIERREKYSSGAHVEREEEGSSFVVAALLKKSDAAISRLGVA